MFKKAPKTAAALAILLLFYSCSVSKIFVAPDEWNKVAAARSIIIQTSDGKQIELAQAWIDAAKITGTAPDGTKKEIDIASVQAVIIEESSGKFPYVLLGVLGVTAWLALGVAIAPSPPPTESCPLVYSFDGERYVLEAEPYGAAVCRALKRSEWIGLNYLKNIDGQYQVRVANELNETEYTDEVKLLIVDHPPGVTAVPDAMGRIHAIADPLPPLTARDKNGGDVRPLVARTDGKFWKPCYETMEAEKAEDLRDELTLEFPKPEGARTVKLVANAWTTFWGSQVARSFLELYGRSVGDFLQSVNSFGPEYRWILNWFMTEELYLLKVQVETASGWKAKSMIYGGGPFVAKDKAYLLDISDVPGDTLKIRLRPPEGFWWIDSLAVDYTQDPPMQIMEAAPVRAADHNGQDVLGLLAANDGRFHIMPRRGEYADVAFTAPPVPAGLSRSIILKVSGYYDIHLNAKAEPQWDILEKIHREPGFTLKFACQEYSKMARNEKRRRP